MGRGRGAARRKAAKVPEDRRFQTKPQLAAAMLDRAQAAGTRFAAVVGDSGCGRDGVLRAAVSSRSLAYVFAIPKSQPLTDDAARAARPDKIHCALPGAAWQSRSQGPGEKGERTYDFAMVPVAVPGEPAAEGFGHTLLIRKSKQKTVENGRSVYEFAYFLVHARHGTSLNEMVRQAGLRWNIEDDNKAGKNGFGLEDYQVRTWPAWHHHVTSSMLAHAFTAVKRAQLGKDQTAQEETAAG